ncbi:proline-rich protein PRCC [Prunus yedoensis var. nudiflora]|uniref:Proline-rich protein PRCC n=1 Tax=Prunus yedoensis var. nudiflora TaxID=2094558 RepID=A0A314ZT70_PRUYE|nr:proline-rich protein PRCC [Prunus yedoensis var. nudiflora]
MLLVTRITNQVLIRMQLTMKAMEVMRLTNLAGISGSDASNYGSYDVYGSSAGYSGYGQYGNDWVGGSETAALALPGTDVSGIKVNKKRGRNEVPTEIIEVKQDELMKNRPREDQAKSTGIAFGPSYQPVSTKGKPTKLHKRKHQIGSLYFDMRQKEMELAERRSKGFLTKAETQAKYGW